MCLFYRTHIRETCAPLDSANHGSLPHPGQQSGSHLVQHQHSITYAFEAGVCSPRTNLKFQEYTIRSPSCIPTPFSWFKVEAWRERLYGLLSPLMTWEIRVTSWLATLLCKSQWPHDHVSFLFSWFSTETSILISCSSSSSVTQLCPTLCDPMKRRTPGLPVHHQLLESTQTHVRWVGEAIQPLSSPSLPALNLSQH